MTQLCIGGYVDTDESIDTHEFEIFVIVLSVSKQLCDLAFTQHILKNVSNLDLQRRSCTSSTLTKLNIFVHSFDDCLYLLDERFECLSTLVIKITAVLDSLSNRENKVSRNSSTTFKEILLKILLMILLLFRKNFLN